MADTQAPQAPNSQAYGMRGDQIAAQQAMPLPQTAPQQGAPTTPAQDAQAVDPMALARDFDPGITPLAAPSTRPDEPVTAGLSLGAGAGPEIFSQPARASRAADTLTALAQSTGDDRYLQMAARIRQGGGAR
jgi:hypothetical protein